ncbi:HAD family hydrolase [Mycolicibacterium agri]|uniref:HAD family hydrolase n=1 Tax=Mycolicibacterium agri TaxID=36811 RepID=A0A2A7N0Z8_MYCAG|nr:phosphonatase-like hydrolase [Mycolicibacterium agri]PEG37489.1 HAD family hydrolase [Mycolicibacterium agri]GFG50937.1 phosphonoacetaldehyde hydrolase [Mycolicibacterium agri]
MTDRPIDLVALDIAGTSVDEGGAVYHALRSAVESHTGVPVPDDHFDRWKGAGKREAIAALLGATANDTTEIDAVERDFTARLLDAYRAVPPTPIPGIVDTFALLREQGIKVVLQTGYSRTITGPLIDQVGWRVGREIDAVITSDSVRASRPAPYLIFHAMEEAAVTDVAKVLVAGDTPNDLRAGANAGVRFIAGVLTGAYVANTLRREPHTHILTSAAAIPEALGLGKPARRT